MFNFYKWQLAGNLQATCRQVANYKRVILSLLGEIMNDVMEFVKTHIIYKGFRKFVKSKYNLSIEQVCQNEFMLKCLYKIYILKYC